MHKTLLLILSVSLLAACNPKLSSGLRKKDLTKDVEIVTTKGTMIIRLSDSTPLHRDNFLKLVKQHYYDSILFHRVIKQFMIQGGDPDSKQAKPDQVLGQGGPGYTVPAEFRSNLFHKKGALAAARMGNNVNPTKASSGSQFYIVQGRVFTEATLSTEEQNRLRGYKIPAAHRQVYTTLGGVPHLDQNYTVFGEVIQGIAVIDSIAAAPTAGSQGGDRPLQDVRILSMRLVKRK
jgi:cyclophilin family peptidyl-prolyl cis-trans isomerase